MANLTYAAYAGDTNPAQIIFKAIDIINDNMGTANDINDWAQNKLGVSGGKPQKKVNTTDAAGLTQAVLILPAPPSFAYSYAADWEKVSLGLVGTSIAKTNIAQVMGDMSSGDFSAGKKALGAFIGDKVLNFVKNSDFFKAASLATRGQIGTKETTKQLFKEMRPRSFRFAFDLGPKSAQEAENIKTIAKTFRYYMHPFTAIDVMGSLKIVNYPAQWTVDYVNGYKNHVPIINKCVLTEMTETYGTDSKGVILLSEEGYPIRTKIDLNFTEIELLDRSDIAKDSGQTVAAQPTT